MRTTVDENLATSLAALGYTQSFSLIDTKLVLGYLTVLIAVGLYFADKKFGFNAIFNQTVAAIVIYSILNVALWYLTLTAAYKDVKYIGHDNKGNQIKVATWTTGYEPLYHVKISTTTGTKKKVNTLESTFEFTKLFDGIGYYKEEQLTKLFETELEKIGKKSI